MGPTGVTAARIIRAVGTWSRRASRALRGTCPPVRSTGLAGSHTTKRRSIGRNLVQRVSARRMHERLARRRNARRLVSQRTAENMTGSLLHVIGRVQRGVRCGPEPSDEPDSVILDAGYSIACTVSAEPPARSDSYFEGEPTAPTHRVGRCDRGAQLQIVGPNARPYERIAAGESSRASQAKSGLAGAIFSMAS
jgi:hypothetical protein